MGLASVTEEEAVASFEACELVSNNAVEDVTNEGTRNERFQSATDEQVNVVHRLVNPC